MKAKYCKYCGTSLEEGCDCEREVVEAMEDYIEDYENRPDVQYGWYQ